MSEQKNYESKLAKKKDQLSKPLKKRSNGKKTRKNMIFDPNPKKDCFVGGLPIEATEQELLKYFKENSKNIKIKKVHLVKKKKQKKLNKGFGFVCLQTEKDKEKFMKLEMVYKGKKLDLRKANRYSEQTENVEEFFSTRVFVAGLSLDTSDDDLKELFIKEFKVMRCYVIKDHHTGESKGLGFIDFASKEEAERCVQKKSFMLKGSLINVEPFKIEKKLKAIEDSKVKNNASLKIPIRVQKKVQMDDKQGPPLRKPAFSFCSEENSIEKKNFKQEYLLASNGKKLNEAFMNYELRKMLKTNE